MAAWSEVSTGVDCVCGVMCGRAVLPTHLQEPILDIEETLLGYAALQVDFRTFNSPLNETEAVVLCPKIIPMISSTISSIG